MKKNNPLKKLRLFKKTIAHLNNEQMHAAHGGATLTEVFCTPETSTKDTLSVCETNDCSDSHKDSTRICA